MATERSPHGGPAPPPARPAGLVRAELAELRRYLLDTPPHHDAGSRQALMARIALLERELAASDQ